MKLISFFILLIFFTSCQESKNKNIFKSKEHETIIYENILISNLEAKRLFQDGLNAIENNKYDEAYNFFLKAEKKEPNNVIILNGLGNIESLKGKKDKAEEKYKRSISLDNTYVISYVNYGKLLNQKKQFSEAIKILQEGLKQNPSNEEKTALYYNLTFTMVEIGECQKAKEYAILAKSNSEFEEQRNEISKMIEGIELYCDKL
jgi:tetratricopeptide (TPR) repeat protein